MSGPASDAEGDPFAVCPVARAFEEIGSKWRLVVLHALHTRGEQRFSELQSTANADSATLARVLEELEERGLVDRRLEDRPVAAYYDLTEKGDTLADVLEGIERWADEWTAAESTAVGDD